MNYGEVKRLTLKLIFSDTVGGQLISESYNDQADYIKALPGLVDAAQTDIAARGRKIPALCPISELNEENIGAFRVYKLPEDCRETTGGGLLLPGNDGEPRHYPQHRIIGGKLWLPRSAPEGLILEYRRCPRSVGESPGDDCPLDNSPETHYAIAYYAAAQLLLYDDSFRYAALKAEYERYLAALRVQPGVEESRVYDVYGFTDSQEV